MKTTATYLVEGTSTKAPSKEIEVRWPFVGNLETKLDGPDEVKGLDEADFQLKVNNASNAPVSITLGVEEPPADSNVTLIKSQVEVGSNQRADPIVLKASLKEPAKEKRTYTLKLSVRVDVRSPDGAPPSTQVKKRRM